MKKIIKLFSVVLIFTLIISFSFDNVQAKEKTLGQLRAEAKANRDAYNKAKNQKALSEQEKATAISRKAEVENQIKTTEQEITATEAEINKLQKEIDKKDKQIKSLMSFVQISNGESNYLEYAFGASSFTDFIYRISVAEQMSDYNDQLIKEYNDSVKKLDQKKTELNTKQAQLSREKQELTELEAKLNKEIETLQHGMLTKDREYQTTIDLVNSLVSLGCKESETKNQCLRRKNPPSSSGGSISGVHISSSNGTYMPIARGRVTSDFGGARKHTGIDFSNSRYGDNVYPVASGLVILVQSPGTYTDHGRNCGNYIVYVLHNINGHPYVTSYWHLASPSVRKGQNVTANTVIGKMGGLPSVDACSSGVHVHVNLFNGNTWDIGSPNSGRKNLRNIMPQIPSKGVYFTR